MKRLIVVLEIISVVLLAVVLATDIAGVITVTICPGISAGIFEKVSIVSFITGGSAALASRLIRFFKTMLNKED